MEKVIGFLKRKWLTVTGVLIGAIGGFMYWYFVGCVSGTCPITSSPLMSTLWGALIGGAFMNMFEKKKDE